jgi:RsiW-degrading membrane proteinase PrsW (M82 family)
MSAAFVMVFVGTCAFGVTALVWQATGVVGFALGVLLATLPAVVGVTAILWIDRYEPEPPRLMWFLFLWGAAVAALAAAIVNTATNEIIAAATGEEALTTTAVVTAPFVEEGIKGLGILIVALARRSEFDGPLDGIVYAGLVGIGFAFTENVLYFGEAFLQGTEQGGVSGGIAAAGVTFFLRGVLGPFAHPLFTMATGIGIGIAVTTSRAWLRIVAPVVGYLVAVSLHSFWNLSATAGLGGFLASYAVIVLPLLGISVATVLVLRSRESARLRAVLPEYAAAGWIAPYDVAMIASLEGRRRARQWAGRVLGPQGYSAMSDYQAAATELGFLRDRARRITVPDFAEREEALLLEVARARAALLPALRQAG